MRNLELQYQGLILEALACYASEKEMTVQEEAREFAGRWGLCNIVLFNK